MTSDLKQNYEKNIKLWPTTSITSNRQLGKHQKAKTSSKTQKSGLKTSYESCNRRTGRPFIQNLVIQCSLTEALTILMTDISYLYTLFEVNYALKPLQPKEKSKMRASSPGRLHQVVRIVRLQFSRGRYRCRGLLLRSPWFRPFLVITRVYHRTNFKLTVWNRVTISLSDSFLGCHHRQ